MDLVSDMVARIKNAQIRRHIEVRVLKSKLCIAILECLYEEGYIRGIREEERTVIVLLKYKDGEPVIEKLERISKRSRRVYKSYKELEKSYTKENKIYIYTGSKGITMNNGEKFKEEKEGGEVLLCIV